MRDPKQMIVTVVVLVIICAVAAGALAWVNSFTEPLIKEAKAKALQLALDECLASATEFSEDQAALGKVRAAVPEMKIDQIYRGTANGQTLGYVFTVNMRGYSSDIQLMVGVNTDGQVENVKVLSQTETPGLGTKVADEEFINQKAFYDARAGERLAVTKDGGQVQAVTGATISSRAVVRGINQVLTANTLLTQ